MQFTRETARKWMQANCGSFQDPKTGEINCTELAEECATNFDVDEFGGVLEDETHWIWDIALEVAEAWEKKK